MTADERKLATVLFADLVGSTALADGDDPERTRVLLERFYDALASEIERAGGTVEKFAGDAVMAAFGVPAAHEDHAERALHAALGMRRRLRDVFGDSVEVRIGVNSGEVVVGRAREGSSFVSGDAVNVAARLEQAAAPSEILAGERTVSVAAGAFEFGEPAVVEARGKRGGVHCRRLVRALTLQRPRGVAGLNRAFVGRASELRALEEVYAHAVETREPHLVSIVGDAGVGKTRLARELWERLAAEVPEPMRRTGRCLAYGGAITYWPLGEVLKEHFALLDTDGPEAVLERLAGRELLGLTLGLDVAGGMHPLAARERLEDAWVDFLQDLAAERPVVMLVEDLHWAEDELLDLLETLARRVAGPFVLIATMRPELLDARPGFGAHRSETRLWVEALSTDETETMLRELLGEELPESLRRVVVGRADGNPFFVEELVGTLVDNGVLTRAEGAWTAGSAERALSVPDTVQAVVAARIDLLGPAEKAALQAASVIGRVFWSGPVYALLEGVEPDLAILEERDFVRRRPSSSFAGEREYAIKHALTREIAYAGLPKARRAQAHAGFAAWLERTGAPRDELASMLAYHYAEAVRLEDVDLAWSGQETRLAELRASALEWLCRAADGAMSRYEIDDSLRLLQQALELAPEGPPRAGVWRRIARANALRYAGEEFWTATQNAIAETPDPAARAELYADLAYETSMRSGIWRTMPAKTVVEDWVERVLSQDGVSAAARAKALIARARWDPVAGAGAAIEASAIAERLGSAELRSSAWDARGIVAFVAGEYDLGRAFAERRFDLLDAISDPDIRADIHSAPITGCIWSGRFNEARRLARRHDEIASRLTPHHRVHGVSIELEVEELLGRWDEVSGLQARAEERVEENVSTPCVRNARALLVCALANEHLGQAGQARRLEERAQDLWMEGYGMTLDSPLMYLALARGELGTVEELLAKPDTAHGWHRGWFVFRNVATRLDCLAAIGDRARVESEAAPHLRRSSYVQPFAQRALGVARDDESLVRAAAASFEAFGLEWHAEKTLELLG